MNITLVVVIAVVVIGMVLLISVIGSFYRKIGPNRALIVYGRGGTKVVVGGGTVVMPLFQKADEFNLELMSFDVAPSYALYTNQGITIKVEAITQLKVENEDEKIKRAANQFLSKTEADRELMVRQVMEGHLRGIVGQLTVEQLVKDPELVSARMRETVAADLDKLGLEVVSFTLKDVTDESGYIQNMSRPEIARNKQMAEIAEAEAERNVAMRQADTRREAAQALAQADQDRVLAQTISERAQAEAQRDLQVKQAEYAATVSTEKARADKAYEIQTSVAQQTLVEEQTKVELIKRQQEVLVQKAEAERRAAELIATVQRQAEAEAERVRVSSLADRNRAEIEAEGQAKAVRLQAEAEAAAIRLRGEAEATALRLKGEAEAAAIEAKGMAEAKSRQAQIDALNAQGQVALADTALSRLPEVARALGESYAKMGNVTYIGTGGDGGATTRIAGDVMGMLPMILGVFEASTGVSFRDIVRSGKEQQAEPHSSNGAATPAPVAVIAGDAPRVVELNIPPAPAEAGDKDGAE